MSRRRRPSSDVPARVSARMRFWTPSRAPRVSPTCLPRSGAAFGASSSRIAGPSIVSRGTRVVFLPADVPRRRHAKVRRRSPRAARAAPPRRRHVRGPGPRTLASQRLGGSVGAARGTRLERAPSASHGSSRARVVVERGHADRARRSLGGAPSRRATPRQRAKRDTRPRPGRGDGAAPVATRATTTRHRGGVRASRRIDPPLGGRRSRPGGVPRAPRRLFSVERPPRRGGARPSRPFRGEGRRRGPRGCERQLQAREGVGTPGFAHGSRGDASSRARRRAAPGGRRDADGGGDRDGVV